MKILKTHKVLLILGNGFDLSLGLKTSYKNFMESEIFKKRVHIKHYPNAERDLHDKNIHNYLAQQMGLGNWIDVEMELKKYAAAKRVEYHYDNGGYLSTQNASDDYIKMSYSLLCLDLQNYINSLDYTALNEDALSLQLYKMIASHKRNEVVSFNYTDLAQLKKKIKCNVEYIHGNIHLGIILGFQRFNDMAPGYEYMIKLENPNYKSCHVYEKMCASDEIVIFGHSLGETDHCYFEPFFEEQTNKDAKTKFLTIFTLNAQSKESIVRQMVSLSSGKYREFQDNTNVTIIETENNEEEVRQYILGLRKRMRRFW